ncbi:MAG: IclR family transcriptional regulator [Verrucomicrobiota bacterium]
MKRSDIKAEGAGGPSGVASGAAGSDGHGGKSLSPSTDRTMAILEALSEASGGLNLSELVRVLGISQNSVYRITDTLHSRGYLQRRESDKRYVMTNRLFDLGRPRVHEKSLVLCAHEGLRTLRDETGETVQLVVRSGRKGVVLEQVSGVHPIQVTGEVGYRVPLYSCAPGKAILAHLRDEEFEDWLGSVELKAFTASTLSDEKALRAELAAVREAGYAVDRAEGLEGIHCVAAPVFDAYQYPVAAVTVMAPLFRLPEDEFEGMGMKCMEAARGTERRLQA